MRSHRGGGGGIHAELIVKGVRSVSRPYVYILHVDIQLLKFLHSTV